MYSICNITNKTIFVEKTVYKMYHFDSYRETDSVKNKVFFFNKIWTFYADSCNENYCKTFFEIIIMCHNDWDLAPCKVLLNPPVPLKCVT